jgi:molybdopterin converting factor small subunit
MAVTTFKIIVRMYGLPYDITTKREVEVELRDGAGMAELIAALREKVPGLDGQVFVSGENRLTDTYKFNVNGDLFYEGSNFSLHPGDYVALLVPVQGG